MHLISVRAEEAANCKELVTLNLSGTKLDKKDTFGKSDPFLVISRVNDDDRWVVCPCVCVCVCVCVTYCHKLQSASYLY